MSASPAMLVASADTAFAAMPAWEVLAIGMSFRPHVWGLITPAAMAG
jgi:hypothetical protein